MAKKKDFIAPPPSESQVPTCKFDLSHINHLTMKFGQAYPCLLVDAPAKSTYNIKPSVGLDFMPFRVPVQSSIRAHMSFYKIPKRILFKNFRAWKTGYGNYQLPYLKRTNYWHGVGSLADYMGIPSTRVTEGAEYTRQNLSRVFTTLDTFDYGVDVDTRTLFGTSVNNNFPAYCRFGYLGHPLSHVKPITFTSYTAENDYIFSNMKIQLSFFKVSKIRGLNEHDVAHYQHFGGPTVVPENWNFFASESLTYVSLSNTLPSDERWAVPSSTRFVSVRINGQPLYRSECMLQLSQTTIDAVNAVYSSGNQVAVLISWTANSLAPFFGTTENNMFVGNKPDVLEVLPYLTVDDDQSKAGLQVAGQGMQNVNFYSKIITFAADINSPFVSYNGNDPVIPISALPFRAYEFIGNYFFRNHEIDPFTVNGVEPFDEYITTDEAGADIKTPLDFFHVPYEYDMFTTCLKTPSFGQSPLVPLRGREGEDGQFAAVHMTKDDGTTYEIKLQYDAQDGTITGVTVTDGYEETDAVIMLKEATNYGISVNDFRNVSALQKFQDRMQRVVNGHGSKYFNFVKEFYGTNAPIGEEFPEYLGGHTETMNVSKLMNTGEQDNLGDFCGVGSVRGKGRNIRCFCSEDCYIMGIIYLTCAPVYSQQLPRLFTKTSAMEFANPAFNNITPQPVYKHQIAPLQLAIGHEHDVFGFNVPFVEYRQMLDECHGNFRTQSMHDYLAQRIFSSAPVLGKDFVYQDNKDIVEIFKSQEDDDKVIGLIHFDMKGCKLPFPQYMVPKVI